MRESATTLTGAIAVKNDRFKNFLAAASIAALTFAPVAALAQAPGFTLPNNSVYQGHLNAAPINVAPTGSGCTIAAGSTDTDFSCTASAASGSITFATAWNVAPFCTITDASATSTVSMPVYSVSTTAITLTTIISTHVLYGHCTGKNGG
jgi:hypothetical protein